MNDEGHEICPYCGQETDPEVCHCGGLLKDHNPYIDGHNFVPMGCQCGYEKSEARDKHQLALAVAAKLTEGLDNEAVEPDADKVV